MRSTSALLDFLENGSLSMLSPSPFFSSSFAFLRRLAAALSMVQDSVVVLAQPCSRPQPRSWLRTWQSLVLALVLLSHRVSGPGTSYGPGWVLCCAGSCWHVWPGGR